MNLHAASSKRKYTALAQLAQNAVDVNHAQTKSIGKNILAERAFELDLRRRPDQIQPLHKLDEEVSRTLDRAAMPDAGEDIKRPSHRRATQQCNELPPPHVGIPTVRGHRRDRERVAKETVRARGAFADRFRKTARYDLAGLVRFVS